VAGLDVRTDSLAVRSRVGYLSEQVPVYPELRVREHLTFRARIKRVGRRAIRTEIQRVADLTGIADKLETPIGHLSRGYRQRVGISDALLGAPPLLVLDEPTVGLDPNQVLEMRSMLRALGGRQTLVFSSHILAEVEALCDRVVILSHGKVVVDASLEQALAAGHVCARWQTDRTTAGRIVNATWRELGQATAPASELHEHGDEVEAMLPLSADGPDAEDVLRAVGRASAREGVALVSLLPGRTRLEERFAEVTGAARGNRG
jgi:ABC-2 type transport system ATP-binding protein